MKRAQAAVIGFIITVFILLAVFHLFAPQIKMLFADESLFEEVREESDHIGNILLSQGYPYDWDADTVNKTGILDGDKLSMRKLSEFAQIDYEKTKRMFGIRYDYMFFIEKDNLSNGFSNTTKIVLPHPINRDFFGWNGYLGSYTGNGGMPFGYFFSFIDREAKYIAKTEKFVYLEENLTGGYNAKITIYTWNNVDINFSQYECGDGVNNDPHEDSLIDYWDPLAGIAPPHFGDPGCSGYNDNNESDDRVIGCRFVPSLIPCSAQEVELLRMSGSVFGNRHAALPGFTGYNDRICCGPKNLLNVTSDDTCDGDAGSDFIRLSGSSNAHLQEGSYANYGTRLCLEGSNHLGQNKKIMCKFENPCGGNRDCIFSMDSRTNAHIGGCNGYGIEVYSNKFCCRIDIP